MCGHQESDRRTVRGAGGGGGAKMFVVEWSERMSELPYPVQSVFRGLTDLECSQEDRAGRHL